MYVGVTYPEKDTTRTYTWFYNEENTTTGGTEIPSSLYWGIEADDVQCYGYTLKKSFPAGTYYIYCVIRDTDKNNPENYAEVTSGTCQLVFNPLSSDDFTGEGTAEAPYLLNTQDDLLKLQEKVNKDGFSYNSMYFKLAEDITLPENWTPLGCTKDGATDIKNGQNLNAFSGTIDGDSHTITVPAGGKPLLGYVKNATVKNLNIKGERIEGAGLVNNYTGPGLEENAITIENVTVKSGTQTLNSGLVRSVYGGNTYASAAAKFVVTIRNCTIESGVTIGYTGKESHIGSFADKINGTIENSKSYATVKGKNYVGGLLGTMDNAMGQCTVKSSAFHGTVEASGSFAGGIVGGGYSNDNSAPNGGRPSIIGCTVDGTVKGNKCVGGITGGDQYVAQTRDNATQSVTGNTFNGTVSGTEYVGGIIGYYNSLNKYDTISGNTYTNADKGIGYVKYIDTSYENPTLMEGTVAFNTGETTQGLPTIQWNTWKADRTERMIRWVKMQKNFVKRQMEAQHRSAMC